MQDREGDIDGPGGAAVEGHHPAAALAAAQRHRPAARGQGNAGGVIAVPDEVIAGELAPGAVLVDTDDGQVEGLPVDGSHDIECGLQRDLVFGRAPAGDHQKMA